MYVVITICLVPLKYTVTEFRTWAVLIVFDLYTKAEAEDKYRGHIQGLAKVFGPLELCDLLPHFRLQT